MAAAESESCPRSVLLIEDDRRICKAIKTFLEGRGYEVECAEDAETAFDLLAQMPRPCLLLVDLLTIRVDRVKLLAMLDREDQLATLPIVVGPVAAPGLFVRAAAVKAPVDMEIVFRIVDAHCCGGSAGGSSNPQPNAETA
jgi:CheY-like chemotaxis protein